MDLTLTDVYFLTGLPCLGEGSRYSAASVGGFGYGGYGGAVLSAGGLGASECTLGEGSTGASSTGDGVMCGSYFGVPVT